MRRVRRNCGEIRPCDTCRLRGTCYGHLAHVASSRSQPRKAGKARPLLRNAPSAIEDNELWLGVERGEGHNSAEEWRARYPFWNDPVRDALLQTAADLGSFFTVKRMVEELGRVENARGRVLSDATIETRLRPAIEDLVARSYLERTDYIAERIGLARGSVIYRITDVGREAALAARVLAHTGEDVVEDAVAAEIARAEAGDASFDFGENAPTEPAPAPASEAPASTPVPASPAPEPRADEVEVRYDPAGGVTVHGTRREQAHAMKSARLRWYRAGGFWYLPRTRDRVMTRSEVERTAEAIRRASIAVRLVYSLEGARSAEAMHADRVARAETRSERLAEKAERTEREAEAQMSQARGMADAIPFGQPLLTDHYSYRSDRNYRDKIHRKMDKAVETWRESRELASASGAAAHTARRLTDPGAMMRRLAKIEADERRLVRNERLYTGDDHERWAALVKQHRDEIAFLREEVKEAPGPNAFRVGDLVKVRGRSAFVLAVHEKSLRVQLVPELRFIRPRDGLLSAPYDRVALDRRLTISELEAAIKATEAVVERDGASPERAETGDSRPTLKAFRAALARSLEDAKTPTEIEAARRAKAPAPKRCGVPGRPRMVEPHPGARKRGCKLCGIRHRASAHRSHVVAGKETC